MVSDSNAATNQLDNVVRPALNFHFTPSLWADTFSSFTLDKQVYNTHAEEIEMLKGEVKNMLIAKETSTVEKLNLINTVERLGVSYHFENEIEEQLQQIFDLHANSEDCADYDLCTTSLLFRLFRQHGFNIPSDGNGNFQVSLRSDIKGLLSLYEAAQLRTHTDIILEEALVFSTTALKSASVLLDSSLGKQVKRALEQPLHKSFTRLESRYYISAYEEDESKNELLLRLAKLDYKILQMLHKQELCELTRWWKELNIAEELPYARNRLVECYFWAIANYFEPQYSLGRIIFTKTVSAISAVDDSYDTYGILDELEILTDALQRWDSQEIDKLPGYMKICYKFVLNLTDEIENELAKQGMSHQIHYYKETWKEYVRASFTQSMWLNKKDIPTFPEYKTIGLITSAFNVFSLAAYSACKSATKEVLDWSTSFSKIMLASMAIGRFRNDVASHKTEKERGTATGVECYMKHYNVSEEEAKKKLKEIAEDAWKDINEELLKPNPIPREILMRILNLARISDVTYEQDADGYTDPISFVKFHIIAMLVDPIIV